MAAPFIDPPAGTQWVLHRNVQVHSGEVGETVDMSGTLARVDGGWEGEYVMAPTFVGPGSPDNFHYWFDRWYFANFRLYLDHVATGEILAVQPDPAYDGPGAISGSPFSAGQNILVKAGHAWVEIDTRIGSGPMWPANLHVIFTLPQWGIDSFGVPAPATPRSGAGLIQWRGDVWVAEAINTASGPPTPPNPPPTVLGATAQPSPKAPLYQVKWPFQGAWGQQAGHEPGEVDDLVWPRMGLDHRRHVLYETWEHWKPPASGLTGTVQEQEFTFVKFAGAEDRPLVWNTDNWDEGVWDT